VNNKNPLDKLLDPGAAQAPDPAALERDLIAQRRRAWGELPVALDAPPTGVAFSGGGIRSATFSLGFAQAFAQRGVLAEVDYLSTVSGGGYTGAFIGSLFLPRTDKLAVPRAGEPVAASVETTVQAAERANRILSDPPNSERLGVHIGGQAKNIFHPLRWLRENGRYLTPAGPKDSLYLAAVYLRALVGVYYVLGLALFAIALGLYFARLVFGQLRKFDFVGDFGRLLDPLSWGLQIGSDDPARLWASPLWLIVPALVVLALVPLVLTYWLVYLRTDRERWTLQDLSIELSPVAIAASAAALIVWRGAWPIGQALAYNGLWLVAYYAVYLTVVAWLLRAVGLGLWPASEHAKTSGEVNRARQRLTKWLTWWMQATLLAAAAALVDSLGQSLFVALLKREDLFGWGAGGAGVVAAVAVLQRLAKLAPDVRGWADLVLRFRKAAAMLVGVIALFALLVVAAAALQAVAWSPLLAGWADGNTLVPDYVISPHRKLLVAAAVICGGLLLLVVLSPAFLNNSTLHRFYAARLTRSFLGAANFERLFGFAEAIEGRGDRPAWTWYVQEAHFGDDVGLSSYHGARSAAPLHIVNVTLNESLSATSSLMRQDRKGAPLAIGPAGIQVGHQFHPWDTRQGPRGIGHLVTAPASPEAAKPRATECERQPLGAWVAISGAAVSTGLGSMSSTGFSILTWLVNARLGYWWRAARVMREERGLRGHPWAGTYDLVAQELFGGFIGRSGRHWNLSDGGHFENTGVYELVRRRVPLIVCADNGADADYTFSDVERLARRVRVDLGAEIEFLDAAAIDTLAQKVRRQQVDIDPELFGTMADFKAAVGPAGKAAAPRTRRCALLAFVRYPEEPARRSLLVVVKPVIPVFAPPDVALYANDNPAFPQQGTGDQFFDEAQWESYRRLGEEIGRELLRTSWYGWVAAARLLAAGQYDAA
jgi:hypothetical protein